MNMMASDARLLSVLRRDAIHHARIVHALQLAAQLVVVYHQSVLEAVVAESNVVDVHQ